AAATSAWVIWPALRISARVCTYTRSRAAVCSRTCSTCSAITGLAANCAILSLPLRNDRRLLDSLIAITFCLENPTLDRHIRARPDAVVEHITHARLIRGEQGHHH